MGAVFSQTVRNHTILIALQSSFGKCPVPSCSSSSKSFHFVVKTCRDENSIKSKEKKHFGGLARFLFRKIRVPKTLRSPGNPAGRLTYFPEIAKPWETFWGISKIHLRNYERFLKISYNPATLRQLQCPAGLVFCNLDHVWTQLDFWSWNWTYSNGFPKYNPVTGPFQRVPCT